MRRAVAQTSVFQLLASFAIPLAVIHTAVNRSQRLFKQLGRYTKYGPSVVGLSFVPVLPYAIDEPIEHGIQKLFDAVWPEQQTAAAPADDTRKDKDNAE